MKKSCREGWIWGCMVLGILVLAAARSQAAAPQLPVCEKVVLLGEVNAGQEWKAAFGQGWVFRVLPIVPGKAGYSGWDLVVDREQPAGFPDALMVATPPYNSINQREVGTTFGLRAQDVIGWNPRSFRFLTSPDAFKESRKQFQVLGGTRQVAEAPFCKLMGRSCHWVKSPTNCTLTASGAENAKICCRPLLLLLGYVFFFIFFSFLCAHCRGALVFCCFFAMQNLPGTTNNSLFKR